jgi:hypothetical protein
MCQWRGDVAVHMSDAVFMSAAQNPAAKRSRVAKPS